MNITDIEESRIAILYFLHYIKYNYIEKSRLDENEWPVLNPIANLNAIITWNIRFNFNQDEHFDDSDTDDSDTDVDHQLSDFDESLLSPAEMYDVHNVDNASDEELGDDDDDEKVIRNAEIAGRAAGAAAGRAAKCSSDDGNRVIKTSDVILQQ
ncbi:uncharacterized protein LOC122512872 [Leptopilina heterotoma]|uniref:uncharacterized protein LOC122512872 n=1 Tax=Leptopilina heterotoma TaxID=63436 RepID=UPI001CA8B597|nr:uncharacterized protein LOC122512872 [Leptopilina heterotoma]